jgi:hypothetical protein
MPTFDTPEPIFATIELFSGSLRINASDRADTVVEVRPSEDSDETDVRTAEQTRVEYADGKLWVQVPKAKARWWLFEWHGSIDVTVDLPAGSRVDARAAEADIHCEGRLGESKVSTSTGDIHLDQTGKLTVTSADGSISVARSVGQTSATSANGEIWIREIDGNAALKTANADITLGEVTGEASLTTAHGDITVDRALASVGAKTATGSVRIGEAVRGSVVLESAYGELEVGVRQGTAAWLDVSTLHGDVHSSLEPSDGPASSDDTVEVRARNGYGDIVIRRS